MDHYGSLWITMDHYGSLWITMDHNIDDVITIIGTRQKVVLVKVVS